MNIKAIRAKLKTRVKFNEAEHTYHLNGKRMINVGALVKRYKAPFDAEYWAEKKAKERRVTKDVVLAEWKAAGDIANNNGHRFHSHAQFRMTGEGKPFESAQTKAFDSWWETAQQQLEVIACEVILDSPQHNLSGTTDLIAFSRKTRALHILDWKTNKKFTTESDYRKWLFNPFAHLPECALSEYSLQVGLYKLMAEWKTGERFGDSFIMHVGDVITPHRAHDVSEQWQEILDGGMI